MYDVTSQDKAHPSLLHREKTQVMSLIMISVCVDPSPLINNWTCRLDEREPSEGIFAPRDEVRKASMMVARRALDIVESANRRVQFHRTSFPPTLHSAPSIYSV